MTKKMSKVDFEKALDMTGCGRYNAYLLILCCCSIIAMTFEMYSLNYIAPASGYEFQTSKSQQKTMMSISAAGLLWTAHLWGYFGDTRGRKRCLLIGTTGGFIISVLSAFSPHWIVLCVLKFIASGFSGSSYPISLLLMAECTPMSKRNMLVIASTSAFLAAFGTMSVLAMPILPLTFSLHIPILNIEFNSWRLLCLLFAIPTGISALLTIPVLESPKYVLAEGKEDQAREILQRIYEFNTGVSGDGYQVNALILHEDVLKKTPSNCFKALLARTTPLYKRPLSNITYKLSGLFTVCYACLLYFVMWLIIPVTAVKLSGSSSNNLTICDMIRIYNNKTVEETPTSYPLDNGVMTAMFGISMTLAALNLVVAGLVKVTGRKNLMIGIQMLSGVALVFVNASSYWILAWFLYVVYLFSILIHGILCSYIIEIYPTYVKSVALCMLLMIGSSQVNIIIQVVEKFLKNYCEIVFYVYGAIAILGGLLGFIMPNDATIQQLRNKRDNTKEEEEKSNEEARL